MATKKSPTKGKTKTPRPPMVAKAGVKHGTRYGCGGHVKK